LTPDAIESILADFRSWLQQAAAVPVPSPPSTEDEPLDLHTLLAQFVALRHEVNLQTKANRAQQEQNAATLEQLSRTLEVLEQQQVAPQEADEQARDEALRPLLKTLVDVHDALARAERQVRRIREEVLAILDQKSIPAFSNGGEPDSEPSTGPRKSFFSRWFGGQRVAVVASGCHVPDNQREADRQLAKRIRTLLDSIFTGYTMSVQRIERALEQAGLEPISCVGQSFDPELMEVVAVAPESGRAAGEVVEEVRRGYLWRRRVFRYAQVSVAKS